MNQQTSRSAVRANPTRDFFLTAAATAWWVAHLWKGNYAEFSSLDILTFLVHCSAVLLAEYLLLTVLTRLLSTRCSPPANALFCTFNVYTTILVHSEQVAALSVLLTTSFLLACTLVFLVVFVSIHKNSFAFGVAMSVVVLLAVLNLSSYVWKLREQQETLDSVTLPARLTYPAFTEKPNVYFVFFDAMIPQAIAKRFLKIDNELEYLRVLRDAQTRILSNVFADRVPTRPSVSAFVALDLAYYESIDRPTRYLQAIRAIPGPLYEVFKRNGYKTQLIYLNNYFGRPRMAKLDYYGIANERGVCDHVDSKHALLGYCLSEVGSFWGSVLGAGVVNQRYPEMLFERITQTAASKEPWLTIAYISYPHHTPKTFNPYEPQHWTAYARKFEHKGATRAAQNLRDLFETLRRNDPNAVLLVLGDHGAYLSRGLLENGIPEDSPLNETEVFLDRHAVVGAVHPANFCADYFQGPIGLAQIAREVIKCLAGGEDPLPSDYRSGADRYVQDTYE